MFKINELPYMITIGKVGENEFRPIEIDVTDWILRFPEASLSVVYSRPDGVVYNVPIDRSGNIIVWTPSSTDLSKGTGSFEVHIDCLGIKGKSGTVHVRVEESISPSGEVPSHYQPWYDEVLSAAETVRGFLSDIENGEEGMVLMRDSEGHISCIKSDNIPSMFMERLNVEKIEPYMYNIRFSETDYEIGKTFYERFKGEHEIPSGACSCVSNGNFFGRTYDYNYDERCIFVTHTPAKNGKHAVLGVAAGTYDLTKEFVDSGSYSDSYNKVPFLLLDGCNDAGLVCAVNEAPTGDYGITTGTNPEGEDLFAAMIPRFVLDYASSVDEAIELLESRNIYAANSDEMKQEYHFMLTDGEKTVVIEFIENELTVIDTFYDGKPIMTNFFLYGYDGSHESLTPYAMGIERQYILETNFSDSDSMAGMLNLMKKVWYTKAYSETEEPEWISEFCGDFTDTPFHVNITKDSPLEDYEQVRNHYIEIFNNRIRNGETWHTVHTSVYDIKHRKLVVVPQESGNAYLFGLGYPGRIYEEISEEDTHEHE